MLKMAVFMSKLNAKTSSLTGAVKIILPACRFSPQQVPNILQLVPLHQLLGLLRQKATVTDCGALTCARVRIENDRADLLFQMQVDSHVFNQYVDKASQEEDQRQDAGPLDNHLLVITQDLQNDFDTHTHTPENPHKNV